MKHVVGGTAGNRIMSLVQWFLDDEAACCNGLRASANRCYLDFRHETLEFSD